MPGWQPKLVVLGTDGSEGSKHAAAVAAAIARHNGASLHVVTVVRPPEGWWGVVGSPPTPQAVAGALASAQREIIDSTLAAAAAEDLAVTTVEEMGDPAELLIAYCVENAADVLVVGKRGAGLIERMVMGSVADRVAHGAPCPVLIVP
jgi:nucleotide-binding universal stress UspA family protein